MRHLLFAGLLFFTAPALASVSGSFKSSTDYYPTDLGEPTDTVSPYLMLDIGGKAKWGRKSRFQWKLFGLANPESEHSPEKAYGDVQELFFERKFSDLKFRMGVNTVNWAVVDVYSPSNVVNPSSIFGPMRSYKRGAPMVEFDWNKEVVGLHAVYIPMQQKALLPSEDSRWLPRSLLVNFNTEYGEIVVPPFLEYEYLDDDVLKNALQHNYGARLNSHLGSFDIFLMHFEGVATQPKVRPTITINTAGGEIAAQSPVQLAPVYYRVRTDSLGAVWAREKWIYRMESAYSHTVNKDELLQPWSWTNVLAAETNIDLFSSTMTVLGQYYYTQNPQAADNMITSSYRLFDRTGLLGFRWQASEKLLLTGSVLYETKTKGIFWTAGFENKLSDALRWGIGWRDFSAQEEGLIKTYDKNDHATLDLTYFF